MKLKLFLFFIILTCNLKSQLYPVFNDKNIGYINSSGKIIIPCEYEADVTFQKFRIRNTFFIDFIVPNWAQFNGSSISLKTDNFSLQHTGTIAKYSLFDSIGNIIIKDSEHKIYGLSENMAVYIHYSKTFQKIYDSFYTHINVLTKEVKDKKYQFASSFNDGLALVLENDKYYFINKKNEKAFDIEIEDAKNFSEGLAAVKIKDLWGYIDINGKLKITPKYRTANNFENGLAKVLIENNFEYINIEGKIIEKKQNEISVTEQNGKYIFVDKDGKQIIEGRFDYATNFENNLAKIWHNEELYYINKKGEKIYNILDKETYKKILNDIK